MPDDKESTTHGMLARVVDKVGWLHGWISRKEIVDLEEHVDILKDKADKKRRKKWG